MQFWGYGQLPLLLADDYNRVDRLKQIMTSRIVLLLLVLLVVAVPVTPTYSSNKKTMWGLTRWINDDDDDDALEVWRPSFPKVAPVIRRNAETMVRSFSLGFGFYSLATIKGNLTNSTMVMGGDINEEMIRNSTASGLAMAVFMFGLSMFVPRSWRQLFMNDYDYYDD